MTPGIRPLCHNDANNDLGELVNPENQQAVREVFFMSPEEEEEEEDEAPHLSPQVSPTIPQQQQIAHDDPEQQLEVQLPAQLQSAGVQNEEEKNAFPREVGKDGVTIRPTQQQIQKKSGVVDTKTGGKTDSPPQKALKKTTYLPEAINSELQHGLGGTLGSVGRLPPFRKISLSDSSSSSSSDDSSDDDSDEEEKGALFFC